MELDIVCSCCGVLMDAYKVLYVLLFREFSMKEEKIGNIFSRREKRTRWHCKRF